MLRKFVIRYSVNLHGDYEVEAESEDEAKKVAEDVYQNDDDLQDEMVSNDESIVCDEVKVLREIGDADGIVDRKQ